MQILIVGPSWVGDMVMAQTLFIALRACYPEVHIDVLAPDWSRPILERMPEVRSAIGMSVGHGKLEWKTRRQLGTRLSHEQYDQAIVLPNSFKSGLVPWFAKIPKRTGWRGEMRYGLLNDVRVLDKAKYPLMIERFLALAGDTGAAMPTPLPRPHLVVSAENVVASRNKHQLMGSQPVLALCPGAEFGEAKRWPAKHYARVAQHQINEGWQVWLFGSQNDYAVAEQIRGQLTKNEQTSCINLAGQTSLADAVDLMSEANAVVSNDSGLMHIAAALNRPLAVVYGSSSPDFTPPLSDNVKILRTGIECSPCFKRDCPLEHLKCLRDLPVERVLHALGSLSNPALGDVGP